MIWTRVGPCVMLMVPKGVLLREATWKCRTRWKGRPLGSNKRSLSVRSCDVDLPSGEPSDLIKKLPEEVIGQVMSAEANFVRVRVLPSDATAFDSGGSIQMVSAKEHERDLLCVVRSVLKKMKSRVLVGDLVKVGSIDWTDARGMVSEVLPRKTELADPPVANLNHVLVLMSIKNPPFDALQATRFLVEAESTGVPISLAVNKTDLASSHEVQEMTERLLQWGYEAKMLSCHTQEGVASCHHILKDRISAVIGPSGVGKSSLINALRRDTQMTVQAVKDVSSIGRGRHTTRAVSFLQLPCGGFLADTPDLSAISSQSLQTLFPEISRIVNQDCIVSRHKWERYSVYARLHEEIQERETYDRQVLQLSKKQREGQVKKKTGKGGQMREEALLEAKRHRRISRRTRSQDLQEMVHSDMAEEEDDE